MKGLGYRSFGLELSGPRTHRSAVAVIDFYPRSKRLLLSELSIPGKAYKDSDEALKEYFITKKKESSDTVKQAVAVHAPLSFPPLLLEGEKAQLPLDQSKNSEVQWMHQVWQGLKPQPRPFLPYLQRPADIYLRYLTPESFVIPDAFSSSGAPLAARMNYLKPHIKMKLHEVSPKVSMQRFCSAFKWPKNWSEDYSKLTEGVETRKKIMDRLINEIPEIFIYDENIEDLILHLSYFQAFVNAMTMHFVFKNKVERRPDDFPKESSWVEIPKAVIDRSEIL